MYQCVEDGGGDYLSCFHVVRVREQEVTGRDCEWPDSAAGPFYNLNHQLGQEPSAAINKVFPLNPVSEAGQREGKDILNHFEPPNKTSTVDGVRQGMATNGLAAECL
ncbi:hypothetical protein O3P69_006328 [Scylla paramamosain]|uniref:Uncharacterized protein n=1 Tax=Scylla paramamosain TaxID=85552 RepID=A0AAW0U2Y3_SCYPA